MYLPGARIAPGVTAALYGVKQIPIVTGIFHSRHRVHTEPVGIIAQLRQMLEEVVMARERAIIFSRNLAIEADRDDAGECSLAKNGQRNCGS